MTFRATPILVAAAVGLAPAAASDATWKAHWGTPRLTIETADLDLTTRDGRTLLDRRIARAATSLCNPVPAARSLELDALRARCVEETIAGTRPARRALIAADYERSARSASAR